MFGPSTGPHAVLGTVEAAHRTSCSLWSDQGIFWIVEAHGHQSIARLHIKKGRHSRPSSRSSVRSYLTPQLARYRSAVPAAARDRVAAARRCAPIAVK